MNNSEQEFLLCSPQNREIVIIIIRLLVVSDPPACNQHWIDTGSHRMADIS